MTIEEAGKMLAKHGVPPRRYVWIGELHEHVLQIARDAGIAITWRAPYASARPRSRRIQLPGTRIGDVVGYAEALHELGHILGPRGRTINAGEHCAWEWARANALFWNDDATAAASQYLSSYYVPRLRRKEWCYRNTITRCRARLAAAMGPIAVVRENRP